MSRATALEDFSQGHSRIHQIDPRVKIVSAVVFACVVAVSDAYLTLLVALFLGAMGVWLARLPTEDVSRRLFIVNGFTALLWLVLPFTYPGTVWFSLGPLNVTHDGIQYALRISLRANAIVLAMLALLATTPVSDLVHALRHLRVPAKLVHLFFFCYRYIFVIEQEYQRLRAAMKIRSFRPRTNLHTYRSYAYLVGMLLIRSYERSQRIYQAMLCRGFQGSFPVYRHSRIRWQDWLCLCAMLLLTTGLVMLGEIH